MWRVTLTPVVLNAAAEVAFLVSGAEKAPMLRRVLEGPHEPDALPAQVVAPHDGRLRWLVDAPVAARLVRRCRDGRAEPRRLPPRRRQHAHRQRARRRRPEALCQARGRSRARVTLLGHLRGPPRRARLRRLPGRAAALPGREPAGSPSPRGLLVPRELSLREPALPGLARRARAP